MPEIIEITAYKLSELDDRARETARDGWRNGHLDYEWWDAVYEDADNVAEILGIDIDRKHIRTMEGGRRSSPSIWFNGFYTQGSGSAFDGDYAYRNGALGAVRQYAPMDDELHKIASNLQAIQRRYFYRLSARIRTANRETSIRVDVEHSDRRWDCPEDGEDAITEAMNDFNHWVFRRLEQEYEYLMSDEVIDESIEANQCLFDERGALI